VIVKLASGSENVAVDLRGLRVRPLQPSAPRGAADPARLLSRAVDFPIDGPALDEAARGRRSAVVVVPDATRRTRLPDVLPVVFNRLLAGGVPAASTEVLVACGTHPRAHDDEIASLLGSLPNGVTVRQHDCRDASGLTLVGELGTGVPVRLDSRAVAADLLITVGAVRHHYFAGFGGGPKMVFPGIAGHDEIQANHARVLRRGDNGLERHPRCEPGVVDGNPVAQEIARAADLRPPDVALCLVPGRDGAIAWAGAGPWRRAFAAAIERARAWYEIEPQRFRRMVVGAGGAPSDATLIQAHKALDAACRFVEPGAEIVFVAELGQGAGSPAMEPFLADPAPTSILERLANGYVQYGHTTLRILEKTTRHRIHLRSKLDGTLVRRLGFVPVDDLHDVTARWRAEGDTGRIGVMSEGLVWPRRSRHDRPVDRGES
jgi:nickel-dependent lactate racemase